MSDIKNIEQNFVVDFRFVWEAGKKFASKVVKMHIPFFYNIHNYSEQIHAQKKYLAGAPKKILFQKAKILKVLFR